MKKNSDDNNALRAKRFDSKLSLKAIRGTGCCWKHIVLPLRALWYTPFPAKICNCNFQTWSLRDSRVHDGSEYRKSTSSDDEEIWYEKFTRSVGDTCAIYDARRSYWSCKTALTLAQKFKIYSAAIRANLFSSRGDVISNAPDPALACSSLAYPCLYEQV